MKTVLVTGSNGQLGKSIQGLAKGLGNMRFIYMDVDELDICDPVAVNSAFEEHNPDYCVNCAAYTQVDKAESEVETCFAINAEGAGNLARACSKKGSVMIQISTDFVFDGNKRRPYEVMDAPNPLSVYGRSKLKGEELVREILSNHFIVRTSWVYSEHGHNFVKTILRLGREKKELNVVSDQVGSPTYAGDLAEFILWLIDSDSRVFGTYHFTNEGEISWYEFAREIFKIDGINIKLSPIYASEYKTAAARPKYSKLSTENTVLLTQSAMRNWKESLHDCLYRLKKINC